MTTKETTLKPCPNPWCKCDSGTADTNIDDWKDLWLDEENSKQIRCPFCGVETNATHETWEEAIEDWNNRPEEDRLKSEITRLKVENELLRSGAEYDLKEIRAYRMGIKEPHPTCETCEKDDDCTHLIADMDGNHVHPSYCSAHTELKKGDS